MSRIKPTATHPSNLPTVRYHALRAQAAYLRNPNRTDGPSKWEAEEVAAALDTEADTLCETLFYAGADRAARVFTSLPITIPSASIAAS